MLCLELGCLLLCFFTEVENALKYTLLVIISLAFAVALFAANRIVTVVTYDAEKKLVTRRGLFGGFRRELLTANLLRTEVRMIPKEQEYILLLCEGENECFDSLSPAMPIRVPNNAKGRAFVAQFYSLQNSSADVEVLFEFNNVRQSPAKDGYRPAHQITDGYLASGIHHYYNTDHVSPGEAVRGTITFLTPHAYPNSLWIGKRISIQEGARVVGYATIVEILNPTLRA